MKNPATPKRAAVPPNCAVEILWQAAHTCCMCTKRKDVQIHHIDGDPANNSPDNLAPLCPNCHSDAEQTGGHGRGYTKDEIKKYRHEWFATVRADRQRHGAIKPRHDLSVLAAFEVRKVTYGIEDRRRDWNYLEEALLKLVPYARDFGFDVRSEVLGAASLASDGSAMGMTLDVARALNTVLLELLPIGIGGLHVPSRKTISKNDKTLLHGVIAIADGLAWNFARYARNGELLQEAAYILYAALRFSHLNGLAYEERQALNTFTKCEAICDEPRNGQPFPEGKEILKSWRESAVSLD